MFNMPATGHVHNTKRTLMDNKPDIAIWWVSSRYSELFPIYMCDIPWNAGSAGTLYTLISPPVPQGPSKM